MKYEYKTLAIRVSAYDYLEELNSLYKQGWEFLNATPEHLSSGGNGWVYFTIRRKINKKPLELTQKGEN